MRLTALDERAEAIGLRKHQGLTEARALYPQLEIEEESPAKDRDLLLSIADWCDRYTPLVAQDGDDGLFLDITGCTHLFGSEEALLEDVLRRLFVIGFDVRGAVASSPGLAWAIAHFGRGGVVKQEENVRNVLFPLPIQALRLETSLVASLSKLGLKRIGDLAIAPRAPLARRFGTRLLQRLDQALGREEEPISPRRPVANLSAERRLAEPIVSQEDILYLTTRLAASLKRGLEARGVGGRRFELVLFRVDGKVLRIAIGASQPLRDPERISRLFSERLAAIHDDLDAGFGFEILRLNVLSQEDFNARQGDFAGKEQSETSLPDFIDRVSARLGPDCLHGFFLQESHIPEKAAVAIPAAANLRMRTPIDVTPPSVERPLRLLKHPEPMEAYTAGVPDGPPGTFRWRRTLHRTARSEGPERIEPEWWNNPQDARVRDYFRLEDEQGYRFWIYREGFYSDGVPPRWFVHGIFA
ncbi:protein ImuB [Pararhizobium capsulatum DSM 1112]|uniref:DNA-directed DNA polymerase n=1 Tax=Pararhizobium capsulatum DSM 1112 TaxID=1121113 RepID=A0ABU0BMN4_9HYPH|nr:protein ImuB [Pararhizobium capsulatum DSM 1112]